MVIVQEVMVYITPTNPYYSIILAELSSSLAGIKV